MRPICRHCCSAILPSRLGKMAWRRGKLDPVCSIQRASESGRRRRRRLGVRSRSRIKRKPCHRACSAARETVSRFGACQPALIIDLNLRIVGQAGLYRTGHESSGVVYLLCTVQVQPPMYSIISQTYAKGCEDPGNDRKHRVTPPASACG